MISYLKVLRIKHWIKNLFLFAAPFFGGKLFEESTLHLALPAFISFSFCASSIYIFNDIRDIERDRVHPEKRNRPIASGKIRKNIAYLLSAFLFSISLILSFKIGFYFFYFIILYFLVQVGYSIYLKTIPILDIFCIASGFVIRVLAGSAAFNVEPSRWLLLTMFMISLVLATGKRLGEVSLLEDKIAEHRNSLNSYSISTLNEILVISSSAALIAYSLYTVEQFRKLIYTVPVVTFGLFRYLMISKQGMGDPTKAMTHDKLLAATILIWLLLVWYMRY
ncbi:MAG: decaprenyl-phosphate phosphoribosyltransferase [Nitrospirae bacterium]|jgi:4-hydroxybenzoate polyprenyltransferase|nr:decaprenyl-phosphate phosphoribosyltransferase [Nitrospirota bacterium]